MHLSILFLVLDIIIVLYKCIKKYYYFNYFILGNECCRFPYKKFS